MSLKLATHYDVPEVLTLLEALHAASHYSKTIPWIRQDALTTVKSFIDMKPDQGCIVLQTNPEGVPIGVFMMTYMNHLYNKTEKTAVEVAFWIDPTARTKKNYKELLGAYKYWAKKSGCTSLMMGKMKSRDEVETYSLRKVN